MLEPGSLHTRTHLIVDREELENSIRTQDAAETGKSWLLFHCWLVGQIRGQGITLQPSQFVVCWFSCNVPIRQLVPCANGGADALSDIMSLPEIDSWLSPGEEEINVHSNLGGDVQCLLKLDEVYLIAEV